MIIARRKEWGNEPESRERVRTARKSFLRIGQKLDKTQMSNHLGLETYFCQAA